MYSWSSSDFRVFMDGKVPTSRLVYCGISQAKCTVASLSLPQLTTRSKCPVLYLADGSSFSNRRRLLQQNVTSRRKNFTRAGFLNKLILKRVTIGQMQICLPNIFEKDKRCFFSALNKVHKVSIIFIQPDLTSS